MWSDGWLDGSVWVGLNRVLVVWSLASGQCELDEAKIRSFASIPMDKRSVGTRAL